jgi:hypothetical protein
MINILTHSYDAVSEEEAVVHGSRIIDLGHFNKYFENCSNCHSGKFINTNLLLIKT